ncbi:MAG: peptidase T [Bacteroidota bacterium]|jgi:tripeptide aminopeptidase|nr:peptidase T [Bacteroidota bacterium]
MIPSDYQYTCVPRFLKYVQYDTQSDENSETFPSTEKQKILGAELVEELRAMGLTDAAMDEFGYVMATIPATTSKPNVPTIGFIAHMDTSPDVSGANVRPVLHEHYDGTDIVLPADPGIVITVADNPELAGKNGETIITADGTTLLGADNKSGIAEILDAAQFLLTHPDIPHGTIRICITPDEEIGQGTKYFDVARFGATYAYTVDGEQLGSIENETFCADSLTVAFEGVSIHPGFAKDKLLNSVKMAARFIEKLPPDALSPETTEKKQGYVHPHGIAGGVETTTVKFLLRAFTTEELREQEAFLRGLVDETLAEFPKGKAVVTVEESYRNMRYVLDEHPQVLDVATEAMKRVGLTPEIGSIRGGTDGARLSYMGLPCPNIFAGEHSFHSKREWVSVQDMEKAVQTIVAIASVYEERA